MLWIAIAHRHHYSTETLECSENPESTANKYLWDFEMAIIVIGYVFAVIYAAGVIALMYVVYCKVRAFVRNMNRRGDNPE